MRLIVFTALLFGAVQAQAQQLQFFIYNKYGQRQGGCYVDKQSCERVIASYNKSNASMGQFC